MSSKGGKTTSKRLALPRVRTVAKKERTWAIHPSPGPHSFETAVPLGSVLRDVLNLTTNMKETKRVLHAGQIQVNGKVRRDHKYAVGLFDVVKMDEVKKAYRMVLMPKGRLVPVETDAEDAKFILQKVIKKMLSKKGEFQLTTNGGLTFFSKDKKAGPGSSLKIDLSTNKVVDVFEQKEGQMAYVTGGAHTGTIARIETILPATMQKASLVELSEDDSKFQTIAENILVIGEKKSALKIGK